MYKTKHASVRLRQRGFKEEYIPLIMGFGSKNRRPGGVYEYTMRNKDVSKALQHFKKCIQILDKLKGTTLIVDDGETIITAYHKGSA